MVNQMKLIHKKSPKNNMIKHKFL